MTDTKHFIYNLKHLKAFRILKWRSKRRTDGGVAWPGGDLPEEYGSRQGSLGLRPACGGVSPDTKRSQRETKGGWERVSI